MSATPPYPATALPHIFKLAAPESFPTLAATPGTEQRPQTALGVRLEFLGWTAEPGRWGGPSPLRASSGRQVHSHTQCPAPVRASDTPSGALQRGGGHTTEPPDTVLLGLKLQHPKQGLKMQSWG